MIQEDLEARQISPEQDEGKILFNRCSTALTGQRSERLRKKISMRALFLGPGMEKMVWKRTLINWKENETMKPIR